LLGIRPGRCGGLSGGCRVAPRLLLVRASGIEALGDPCPARTHSLSMLDILALVVKLLVLLAMLG